MLFDSNCFNEMESRFTETFDNPQLWNLRRGDILFAQGDDPRLDMDLAMASGDWYSHVWAYKTAADNLVSVLVCGRDSRKMFIDVYPVLALYRQYVELALKNVIVRGYRLRDKDVPNDMETHNLKSCWDRVQELLQGSDADDETIEWDLIGDYVRTVAGIPYDLGRFPWTRPKKDKPRSTVDSPHKTINLIQLRVFMTRLGNSLESLSEWLGVLSDNRAEAQADNY